MGSILTSCVRFVNEIVDDAQTSVNGEIDKLQRDAVEMVERPNETQSPGIDL